MINAENTTSTSNKDYKVEIKTFVALLMLRYEKLELNKFLMFSERSSSTT